MSRFVATHVIDRSIIVPDNSATIIVAELSDGILMRASCRYYPSDFRPNKTALDSGSLIWSDFSCSIRKTFSTMTVIFKDESTY